MTAAVLENELVITKSPFAPLHGCRNPPLPIQTQTFKGSVAKRDLTRMEVGTRASHAQQAAMTQLHRWKHTWSIKVDCTKLHKACTVAAIHSYLLRLKAHPKEIWIKL